MGLSVSLLPQHHVPVEKLSQNVCVIQIKMDFAMLIFKEHYIEKIATHYSLA